MVIFIFYRISFFILGIAMISISSTYFIICLSLFNLGFSLFDYIRYICSNSEMVIFLIGIILLTISLFFDEKWKKFIAYRKARRHL